jgi:hypothetical protein
LGAVSSETQTIRGLLRCEGESYRDDLVRIFVDVADEVEHRRYFLELKARLKERFEQIDIWMATARSRSFDRLRGERSCAPIFSGGGSLASGNR